MDNINNVPTSPKVTKETKKKIKVDFERTSLWERIKIKYFSSNFAITVLWKILRLVLLIGISYIILFPFFTKITTSFMSGDDFVDATVKLIPKYPTLDTYKAIIRDNGFFTALGNSTLLSLACAVIQTIICSMIGYGFAKFKFRGSKLLFALVMLTMIVPHGTLKFSMFMNFRYFDIYGLLKLFGLKQIDMINSYWPLIILSVTGLGFKNGLYIFMMRQFFKGIPDELEESAYIDGYGCVKTFVKIIIPLSVPMMITVFLFAFAWQWTDNFYTNLFFTTVGPKLMPSIIAIPKSLDTTMAPSMFTAAVNNACAILIILPLIIIYLFCQKFLVQGIERSGITG